MHFMCQGCVQNWSALLRTQHEPKSLDQSAFMQASVSVKQHMRFAERTWALEQGAQAPARDIFSSEESQESDAEDSRSLWQ